ncbi:class I SAM-dependent methyltransferase [Chitinivorax sp. B]|uniref:class I SAM-dependent methyltransferase n=1 Tax=Chitinivorax sp. B TaxID=2502235 RepID=UPI0010F52D9B|nr:class I SAM-dependent methyltransferase [Chitinivorax sp. B]
MDQLVITQEHTDPTVAAQLAAELGLPLADVIPETCRYTLTLTPDRLELRTLGKGAPGPIYVDFVEGANAHRRKFGGGRGQLLPKAAGLKGDYLPHVVDATAGLGRDAFVLASLGCQVTMIERSPIAFALLRDGLQRAQAATDVTDIAARMMLIRANATEWLGQIAPDQRPDVVVVDPMFPDRGKAALAKKEMQAFQVLIGDDLDAECLLEAALGAARRRVIVKRPRLADIISGAKPSTQIIGQSTRFDVYVRPVTHA